MNGESFFIPIDDSIQDFLHHLDTHDRTILSARFGDGKTFFLSHFMEDDNVKEKYTFLTIFPVNYQVTDNRDIFELIKRDILLQMLVKGVVETEIEVNNDIALALYLQCQPLGFAESFLQLLSEQALNGEFAKTAALALAGKKFFKSIKQKLDGFKQQSRDNLLENFFNAVEHNPVVGQDAISSIINQCLKQYRDNHPNKQVVLVIEDLDRIDPAHLFRILNIFSAHIDFCYRLGKRPDETLVGNKFGLDKVVFVMHYENVQKIYRHFYGADTNFDGYIEKFCSSTYFPYSLQNKRDKYFQAQLVEETGLPANLVNELITSSDFNNLSIRKVANAIHDTKNFVLDVEMAKTRAGKRIPIHTGILRMIALLRKCGISDAVIAERLKNAIVNKDAPASGIFMYIAPFLCLEKFKNSIGSFRYANSMRMTNFVQVDYVEENGLASCSFFNSLNEDNNAELELDKLLYKLLKRVAR